MTVKEKVLELVLGLDDDCSLEDIQYHLYVLGKVQESELAASRGEIVSMEQAKQRLSRWRAKSGGVVE